MTCNSPISGTSVITIDKRKTSHDDKSSMKMMVRQCSSSPVSLSDWGFPGYLTDKEFAVYVSAVELIVLAVFMLR
jgi:hypothetical protein